MFGEIVRRGLIIVAITSLSVLFVSSAAWGSDTSGGFSGTSAGATAGNGQVTVQAGQVQVPPASPGGSSKNSSSGKPTPASIYVCTTTPASPAAQKLLGVGGATPGEWVVYACPGAVLNGALPFEWLPTAAPPVALNVGLLALQAESKLPLASPTIETAPPSGTPQLVGVPTWLWIDSGPWQDMSATATAGMVVATATAIPAKVVWNMGDGNQVTCDGPGTVYDPSTPNAATDCSHTWTQPSSSATNGEFTVTATVYWQVAWTAAGAPGGGTFGLVAGPTTQQEVRVTESQAINTPSTPGT
jgi:hypothetical protein